MVELNDFLEHHGILGQKWGRHKANSASYKTNLARGKAARKAGEPLNAAQKAALSKHKERVATGVQLGTLAGVTAVGYGAIGFDHALRNSPGAQRARQRGVTFIQKAITDHGASLNPAKIRSGVAFISSLK